MLKMRENTGIFRGKRIDNGEWAEGYLTGVLGGGFWIDESTKLGVPIVRTVYPNTIGECTGLRDKNGKLIFEGDILEGYDFDAEDGFGVVEWDDGAWEVISEGNWLGTFHENYNGYEFEIIGNIHDNPELLKEGAD